MSRSWPPETRAAPTIYDVAREAGARRRRCPGPSRGLSRRRAPSTLQNGHTADLVALPRHARLL